MVPSTINEELIIASNLANRVQGHLVHFFAYYYHEVVVVCVCVCVCVCLCVGGGGGVGTRRAPHERRLSWYLPVLGKPRI